MNDFDFLRKHGYGVVYGEEATRKLINTLGHNGPRKGNKMNEITEVTVEPTVDVAPEVAAGDEAFLAIKLDGDRVIGQDEAFSEDEVR